MVVPVCLFADRLSKDVLQSEASCFHWSEGAQSAGRTAGRQGTTYTQNMAVYN